MNLLTGEANVLTGPLFFKRTRQKIKNKKAATSQIPAGCAIFWAFSVKILSYFLVLLSHIITDPQSKTRTRQRKVFCNDGCGMFYCMSVRIYAVKIESPVV